MSLLKPEITVASTDTYTCVELAVFFFNFETNFNFGEHNRVLYCDGSLDRGDSNQSMVLLNEPSIFTYCIFCSLRTLQARMGKSQQGLGRGPWGAFLISLSRAARLIFLEYKYENASFLLNALYRLRLALTRKFRALQITTRFLS